MALNVKVGNFAAATSTGSQAITGVGFLPKIVIFFYTGRTTSGAGAVSSRCTGWGAFDGTNEVCNGLAIDDGASHSADRANNDKVVRLFDRANTTLSEADGTSLDADGFTINWSTNDATAYLIGYLALGGSDITNAVAGSMIIGTGSTTSETIGFAADGLIFGGADGATSFPATGNSILGIGVATGVLSTEQHAISGRKRHGSNTTFSGYDSGRCWVAGDDSATPNQEYHVSTIDSTSFTLTKDVGGTNQAALIYVAIAGAQFEQGVFQSPNATTGTQTVSGLGFDPVAVLFDSGCHTGADTYSAEYNIAMGAMSGATEEFCIGQFHTDTNLHDETAKTDKALSIYTAGTPTLDEEFEFSSFGTTQFVINWTTSHANQNRIGWLAIGAAVAGGATGKSNPLSGPFGGPFSGPLG